MPAFPIENIEKVELPTKAARTEEKGKDQNGKESNTEKYISGRVVTRRARKNNYTAEAFFFFTQHNFPYHTTDHQSFTDHQSMDKPRGTLQRDSDL
ncbi:uncharacterized protein BCR38DRAFT_1956 [Pseudomassariella vexata]|uniref:Uncharacterized protein n=1 Tax=Pseudomassariella vexata TaxID=1141098 RepID=A0A1Y2EJJ5_9PEZI|nr:uncharacterized protein BCR38DRAFT_1956 [Pseudomassariella vexata]ORY70975.1 hypothetical protein BCR38DRAFT_1956 [Pseudomassariella vexata]